MTKDQTVSVQSNSLECDHRVTHPTRFTMSNGAEAIYQQCHSCGEKRGQAISKASITNWQDLPPFDVEKQEERRAQTQAFYDARRAERQEEFGWEKHLEEFDEKRDNQNREWWSKYNAYLQTPHWRQLRQQALKRDHFLCQNCFCVIDPSHFQAHHLSYKAYNRVGYSFVFEVVTLCHTCHKAYHSIENEGETQ